MVKETRIWGLFNLDDRTKGESGKCKYFFKYRKGKIQSLQESCRPMEKSNLDRVHLNTHKSFLTVIALLK